MSANPSGTPTPVSSSEVMDVDDVPSGKSVMAKGVTGSIHVSLHPLVIMNISEHYTRRRAQEGKPVQVIGALIGTQAGRKLEIKNSFELVYNIIEDEMIVNRDYYNMKEEQFKQVFCDLDFLGWYTTGEGANELDIKIHKQICEINESPIFLKLNPHPIHSNLPVSVYESIIDLVSGEATMLFIELPYTIITEEAERMGVDHVARMSNNDSGESSLVAEHLTAQYNAIKMLHIRVKILLDYLKEVEAGTLPVNHEILRELNALRHRLPVLDNAAFRTDFYTQCNDVALITYLGSITKGCNDLNQFVNKFNVLFDKQMLGRKLRGILYF